MTRTERWMVAAGLGLATLASAQEEASEPLSLGTEHSECTLFGPKREKLSASGLAAEARRRYRMSELTSQVVPLLAVSKAKTGASRSAEDLAQSQALIDRYLFEAMRAAGAAPAPRTNDYEFCRRVTYDLVGRPPTAERLVQFAASPDPDKRAAYVNELLNRPEWVDKWQMFFSDLFENTQNNNQVNRYAPGRNAFYQYLKDSLAANKPYNVMASELISAAGSNTYEDGSLGFVLGGFVTGSPRTGQDLFDQMAANTAEKFLGIAHENCVLCHDGRGHLDPLSVWGRRETRLKAWQLASFFSRTNFRRVAINPPAGTPYYYAIEDNTAFRVDYPLNTTTGNRPARQPLGTIRNVPPEYPFANGGAPNPGENYRVALARLLTADIQFSRAAVNNIWKQFFVRGIVEPANQFDLLRLDPDNPPAEPWTLQPTNPALLNALAKDFAENGYNLKDLMRKIATSEAYQLSSRYEGEWKPEYEKLFARKFVRRLWGEEVMDGIVQISNIPNTQLNVTGLGRLSWAMQLPDTFRVPAEPLGSFLDSFLRGNRIEEERRQDGSMPQALNLMNDAFVHTRTRASGTGDAASLARQLLTRYTAASNTLLVNELFLAALNRPATDEEMIASTSALAGATTSAARQAKVEDLLWALFNKVDFIYNY